MVLNTFEKKGNSFAQTVDLELITHGNIDMVVHKLHARYDKWAKEKEPVYFSEKWKQNWHCTTLKIISTSASGMDYI